MLVYHADDEVRKSLKNCSSTASIRERAEEDTRVEDAILESVMLSQLKTCSMKYFRDCP